MKTRSSSGVGQKIELEFDIDSLRIRDLPDEDGNQQFKKSGSNIFASIKNGSNVKPITDMAPEEPAGKVAADVNSSALRQMLNNLKQK
jgi:hypothetical protein